MARAFLLIADIGGYTRFLKVHRINLAHAQVVVARLLESIIDGGGRALEVAKLEGDAVFFFAKLPEGKSLDLTATEKAIARIRKAFVDTREELVIDRVCSCDGCVQAGDLKLKFVSHVGDVAFQKVKRHRELAGVDVIFVHRLLKNTVPISEYVLMSEAVHAGLSAGVRAKAVAGEEDLEGLGTEKTYWVDLDHIASATAVALAPSFLRRVWGWLRLTLRSLPYMLGLKKACEGFRNAKPIFDAATPPPPSLPASSMAVPSRAPPPEQP